MLPCTNARPKQCCLFGQTHEFLFSCRGSLFCRECRGPKRFLIADTTIQPAQPPRPFESHMLHLTGHPQCILKTCLVLDTHRSSNSATSKSIIELRTILIQRVKSPRPSNRSAGHKKPTASISSMQLLALFFEIRLKNAKCSLFNLLSCLRRE